MRGAERCSCRLRAPGRRAGRAASFGGQRGAERGEVEPWLGAPGCFPVQGEERGRLVPPVPLWQQYPSSRT